MTNEDRNIRAALDRHWAASDANDFGAEHETYRDNGTMQCSSTRGPESGPGVGAIFKRLVLRSRTRSFKVQRVLGVADLWVNELSPYVWRLAVLLSEYSRVHRREGCPRDPYFADSFAPGPSRAQWVERMR
jgi:hypothetical protein